MKRDSGSQSYRKSGIWQAATCLPSPLWYISSSMTVRNRWFWLLLLLALVAFGARVISLTAQSLWRDEVDALCYAYEFPYLLLQALAPGRAGDLITPCACPPSPLPTEWATEQAGQRLANLAGAMIRQNGPLYYFLLRLWVALTGHSEYALRYLSLLFGVLCVPLTGALGFRTVGRRAGTVAAALMALSPYMVWYGQEVKMYTLVPFLVLLALYGLERAMDQGGAWWAVQVAATTLLLYTHIWGTLLIPVQALWLVLAWPRWRPRWGGALIGMALLTLPYLPLGLWQLPAALVRRETGFPHHPLGEMALILLNGWSTGITGWGWPWSAIALGGAAAVGLAEGLARRSSRRAALSLALWPTVPLLAIWAVSLRQPLFTDRYLIWGAPAFYLLAGCLTINFISARKGPGKVSGPSTPGRPERMAHPGKLEWGGAAVPLLVALIIFAVNLHLQAATPIKADLRAAAAYVESHYRPDDLIIFQIPHIRYTFDYYFRPTDYRWVDGLYTNHRTADGQYRLSEDAAGQWMAVLVGDRKIIWLVASEVEMWDERNLVQGWLESQFRRSDEVHFTRVDVYRYRWSGTPTIESLRSAFPLERYTHNKRVYGALSRSIFALQQQVHRSAYRVPSPLNPRPMPR